MLAAAGALSIELTFSNLYYILSGQNITTEYFNQLTLFLVFVVFLEEACKYFLLYKFYLDSKNTMTLSHAIYFGLGFAFIEVFLAFFNMTVAKEAAYLDLGVIGVLMLHIATAGFIGYFILSNKHSLIKITIVAFSLHMAYNLMVIYGLNYLAIFAYLTTIFLLLAIFSRKLRARNS